MVLGLPPSWQVGVVVDFCTSAWLRACLRRHCSLPSWLIEDSQAHVGDTAETVTLLLVAGHISPSTNRADSRVHYSLQQWCEDILPAWNSKAQESDRDQQLLAWWHNLVNTPLVLYAFNKLLTGGFRLGIAKTTVAKALAAADVPIDVVTEALVGGFEPHADLATTPTRKCSASWNPPLPVLFMASPLPDEDAPDTLGILDDWVAEWKWDGIRAQIIKRGKETAIWSRGEEVITQQFPEIHHAMQHISGDTVLDAELVAWDQTLQRAAPFHKLQKRLGRKRVSAQMQQNIPVRAIRF